MNTVAQQIGQTRKLNNCDGGGEEGVRSRM